MLRSQPEEIEALRSASTSTRPNRLPRSAIVRAPIDGPIGGPLGHRDDIQGLRAVAVLLVTLGHARVPFLSGGFIGVDVFFVLSGFLITGLLLAGAGKYGYVSLREFYARRAKRILPAAAVTLIVTDFAAYHLLNFVRAQQAVLDSIWAVFFSANVQFARQGVDYFAQGQPPSPIQHYWSLAVEEQFYLVWPLLLSLVLVGVAFHRRHRRHAGRPAEAVATPNLRIRRLAVVIMLAGLGSLAWSIYDTPRTPAAAYFSTAARAWELALGAALAIGAASFLPLSDRSRALMGWAGVLAIGVAAVLFSEATPFPGYAALLPTVGTALVIAAGIGNERPLRGIGGLLGRAPLRYIGDRSYAFYLWHWPVLVIASLYVGHAVSVPASLILLVGAFLLSIISYGLIENPIRRATLKRPVRTSAVLWGTSVTLVMLVALFNLRSIANKTALSEAASGGPIPTLGPYTSTAEPPGATLASGSTNPTSQAIPAVVAAVQEARQGAPIPSSLIPPLDRLLHDRSEFPHRGCGARLGAARSYEVCSISDGGATRTIVLFGDSHAKEWMPAVLWAASQDRWAVVPLVEVGCGPAQYGSVCNSYFQWAVHQVQILHPDVVLIGGKLVVDNPEANHDSVSGISLLIGAVKPFAKNVMVIGDPPALGRQPVDCLLARDATLATCTRTLTGDQISVYEDVARAAENGGAAFLDTIGWFCFENQCPMVVGQTITYRDIDHITQTYALELRELFRAAFAHGLSS
jgi:peptidoglycan/LPS O-acetylase OafA/YrhL